MDNNNNIIETRDNGIIISDDNADECKVYSPHYGVLKVVNNHVHPWLGFGTIINFEAVKNILAVDPKPMNNINDSVLVRKNNILKVIASVHQIDESTGDSYLWNDIIGRIRVPPNYNRYLILYSKVVISVVFDDKYNGTIPWKGVFVHYKETSELNKNGGVSVAKKLETTDGWVVSQKMSRYSAVARHDVHGTCFLSSSDFSFRDDEVYEAGTKLRITYFKSHTTNTDYRAIQVSPYDSFGNLLYMKHGMFQFNHSRETSRCSSSSNLTISSDTPLLVENMYINQLVIPVDPIPFSLDETILMELLRYSEYSDAIARWYPNEYEFIQKKPWFKFVQPLF